MASRSTSTPCCSSRDIEVVFIYLWALVFRDVLVAGLISMAVFVLILLLGLLYAWRKGVLTWR